MRGRLIVLEGVDGSGKTTQADLLERRIGKVVRAREPGGTPIGETVRALLKDARRKKIAPLTEIFLFMASRAQLVEEVIRPALRKGRIVLLDRYYYSTAAYQAGAMGARAILKMADDAGFEKPDLVALLDIEPAAALARANRRRDRIERKGLYYLQSVRRAFLAMARHEPKRFQVIRADRPVEVVHEEIYRAVKRVL